MDKNKKAKYASVYYSKNKDKISEYQRAYYLNNRNKIKEQRLSLTEKRNPDKLDKRFTIKGLCKNCSQEVPIKPKGPILKYCNQMCNIEFWNKSKRVDNSENKKKLAVQRRQYFINDFIQQYGKINSNDIMQQFKVGLSSAMRDLQMFIKNNPDLLLYNVTEKCYEIRKKMTESIECPMCKGIILQEMTCNQCQRQWYYIGEYLASKKRQVKIVAPLVEGARLDDCIKPFEDEK